LTYSHGNPLRSDEAHLTSELSIIPVVDVREGGMVRLAELGRDQARGLRDTCVGWFPAPARPFVPALDGMARWWLSRSQSPYVEEVRAIAAMLKFPGVWFLNGSYQWSCTALAREENGAPWLARTLDWPFPGLGRYVQIAHMQGPAGDFYNVTWPGYVGALTALAPGRFAAAVNQAPMRRRTVDRRLRFYDLAANSVATLRRERGIPPDQLLRRVMEYARDYGEARSLLESTPIARPVIYTLAGCRPGERCVIERTERGVRTRTEQTCAANDWLVGVPSWEARIAADKMTTSTFEDAAANSRTRREALERWSGRFESERFDWVAPPVLNPYTRIAIEMCPARSVLRAVGYERREENDLAEPVTLPREICAEAAAT
jgi:hypothetical protein